MVKTRLVEQLPSLVRDLELRMPAWKADSHGESRMNCDEMDQSRKTVLLEKTNCLHEEQHCGSRDDGPGQQVSGRPFWKFGTEKQMFVRKDGLEQKESAFTEVRRMKEKLKAEKAKELEQEDGEANFEKEQMFSNLVQSSPGSAFSFVWPTRVTGEPKSAFSKPAKCLVDRTLTTSHHLSDLVKGQEKLSEFISTSDIMRYSSILTSKLLVSDLSGSRLLQTSLVHSNPFSYPSGQWSRQTGEQMHTTSAPTSSSSSASLTLLPPTFASFGVAAQNWCAKCNVSFRMTSDLVFHMRSHHKKDNVLPESRGKRRRDEKLTCPVCQEYFRERHHLSRHLTSHN
ncbi:zinc finger protein 488 isoform X2 [Hemicordylus capensis]|nr:zinc finger protein 488 isoform X2 [Hemicordylus capensis]XP_053168882.1 zinc finger protein 488 isoform X2 [Hemicordylus capensis]